jgi:hypothetical protein
VLVALEEGARAGGDRLLAAGEEDVDVEVFQPAAAEALGEAEDEGRAGGIVVLAASGGGDGDVEQEGDGHDEERGRDELEDREQEAAEAGEAEDAADEDGELGPEAGLGLLAERDPTAPGVVVRDEKQQPRLVAIAPGHDVLGGAPAEQAADGGEEDAGVEEGEKGGGESERGAEGGDRDREDAADDGERGEGSVRKRPSRPDVDGLELDLATDALEPPIQVSGGPALGIAPGSAPANLDEGVDVSAQVHGRERSIAGLPERARRFGSRPKPCCSICYMDQTMGIILLAFIVVVPVLSTFLGAESRAGFRRGRP